MGWVPPESARYLGAGLQLTVTVLLGVGMGYLADRKLQSLPVGTLVGAFLGFGLGIYVFLKEFTGGKNGNAK